MSQESSPIWRKPMSRGAQRQLRNTLMAHLDIVYTAFGPDWLEATMPVDHRTHQPLGMLHGGASVVLAETLGIACGQHGGGVRIIAWGWVNANHLRAKREGGGDGRCAPLHLGATTQVWARSRCAMNVVVYCAPAD